MNNGTPAPNGASERPILFSGPMVRALLAGTKTQTRRAVKLCDRPYNDGGRIIPHGRCPYGAPGDRLWVRETWAITYGYVYRATDAIDGLRWTPSIFMRRGASRITLEIVSVRAERLQDITDEDIDAEGVTLESARALGATLSDDARMREWWAFGWDAINGKRAPWASNPWVWRVEFKLLGGA